MIQGIGRCIFALLCCARLALAVEPTAPPTRGKAEHVVLMVWDGMRPDFVREEFAPNLTKLATSGVHFRKHHSVYPSLTSVNATALATGVHPDRNGISANWAFRPDLNGGKLARLDAPEIIRKGDGVSGGHFLQAPTIAEMVRARGGRVAIAGTKTASLLHDRQGGTTDDSPTIFGGLTNPATALALLQHAVGDFPTPEQFPNVEQDNWTTRALTEVLWRDGVPEFSLLWMSEPDKSQHHSMPGSKVSLGGIRDADENLGRVLRMLEEKGVRAKTDVLIASDHGFSTIDRLIDVEKFLREKGFNVATEKLAALEPGMVRVAGNSGFNSYYVGDHDRAVITRLVEALQQSDFASVLFTREPVPGTFPFSAAHLETEHTPDVMMSFRWSDQTNTYGVTGMIDSGFTTEPVTSSHGTLSPYDLHNIFIAAGPDFRSGTEDEIPTSNVDVAATIVRILGLRPPQPLDGRVVLEAMTGAGDPPKVDSASLEASASVGNGTWQQTLRTSTVDTSVYLDEGRGSFQPK